MGLQAGPEIQPAVQPPVPVETAGPAVSLAPSPTVQRILALQRSAGNAAVARMLARQGAAAPTAPGDAAPAAGDAATSAHTREHLMSGAFDDTGEYKPDGTGFTAGDLDALLKEMGAGWGGGIDTTAPPTGASAEGGPAPSGGDSAGRSVGDHPPWVAAFQSKLIGVLGKWSADDRVAQRLLQVFLRAWTRRRLGGDMPASVAVFYGYVGAHEENEASQGLGAAGAQGKDSANWCQQASSYAICEALLRNGLRFKSPPGMQNTERFGKSRTSEVAKQAGRYETWLKGAGGERTAWGGDKCWASALSPGDVISFYSAAHGPTSTGHAATVVTGAGPAQEAAITIVSGNAAGESIRVEEVQRVQPPPGLFSGSAKRPAGSKQIFIWSLQRASILNAVVGIANSNAQFSDADVEAAGLERCKPLDELWPPSETLASASTSGAPAPGGGAPTGGGTPATGGGPATATAGGPAPATDVPAPAEPPPPANGGGGSTPQIEGPGGALGSWFEDVWNTVFGATASDEEEQQNGNGSGWASSAQGPASSGGGGPGSQWSSS